ncbi:hypothetical protein TPHV1_500022 [Treponema phagedenis]|uniref:Uncharacterized protein n=1 Tax=Treponema phagedenis TaxID=162 RepID=A0A0B7GW69_TREPH|nr:hypothetical protein TPHV1_500022 [Treponema phagedenis]
MHIFFTRVKMPTAKKPSGLSICKALGVSEEAITMETNRNNRNARQLLWPWRRDCLACDG